jgi:hypothetical protein
MNHNKRKQVERKDRPALPELDQTKKSVINSLASVQSRRSYQYAMDEFIEWYCSEPRLALNRGVVLRYRLQLESRQLAAATINVRLAAVRRLAYEAADTGLLSPELVAGIRRVRGIPQLGRRVGNWLTAAEGQLLLSGFDSGGTRGRRDLAIAAIPRPGGRADLHPAVHRRSLQPQTVAFFAGLLVAGGLRAATSP